MLFWINYFLVIILVCVQADYYYIADDPIQKIGKRIYNEEILTDAFVGPKELAYNSESRRLYFMHMDNDIQNSGRAYVNVVTKFAAKIAGIEKNKATAVDSEFGRVYFGSENGLYSYDPFANRAHNIGLYNVNIMKLVIRNNEIFILDANDHRIYKITFGYQLGTVLLSDAKSVLEFTVDNQMNVHYMSLCGLYCSVGGHEEVKNKDLSLVHHFIVDGNKTLGVTDDGIYGLDCFNGTAKKLSNISFTPTSIITGDYGDIYYSADDTIYRLRPIRSYHLYHVEKRQPHH